MRLDDVRSWDVTTFPALRAEAYVEVFVNGIPQRLVRAFDRDDGWVRVLCTDGHSGYPGEIHMDAMGLGDPCERIVSGEVTLRWVVPEWEEARVLAPCGPPEGGAGPFRAHFRRVTRERRT